MTFHGPSKFSHGIRGLDPIPSIEIRRDCTSRGSQVVAPVTVLPRQAAFPGGMGFGLTSNPHHPQLRLNYEEAPSLVVCRELAGDMFLEKADARLKVVSSIIADS